MHYPLTLEQVIVNLTQHCLNPDVDDELKNKMMTVAYDYMEQGYGMKLWEMN
jgi:hypothetical protein